VETVVALVSAVEHQTRSAAMTFMFMPQPQHHVRVVLDQEVVMQVLVVGMLAMELVNR
jgi:hypothetical protein